MPGRRRCAGGDRGLVTTDNLLVAYGFWELTTVCSFLLIGHDHTDPGARRAARLSLLLTVGFGVPMLVGFIMLAAAAAVRTRRSRWSPPT